MWPKHSRNLYPKSMADHLRHAKDDLNFIRIHDDVSDDREFDDASSESEMGDFHHFRLASSSSNLSVGHTTSNRCVG